MQLVLSNNRVIAHGENFLSMGGTVINTETNKKYENATVVECNGCPSDIDSVGYEYHAGVFVPCAPYGPGNDDGYVMEVCPDCATPRRSNIPLKWFKWESLATVSGNAAGNNYVKPLQFPVDDLSEYAELRIVMKSGTLANNDDEACTGTIEVLSTTCFQVSCPLNEEIHYNDEVIYILRKEKYSTVSGYNGNVSIRLSGSALNVFSMTLELQGRKE